MDEDFFTLGQSDDQTKLEQQGILIRKFPTEQKQAYYLKADVEFLVIPAKVAITPFPVQMPTATPKAEVEPAPLKKIELTLEMENCFDAWLKNPRIRHGWYNNAKMNMDLLEYALQEKKRDLVTICTQNLVKIPKKAPQFSMGDVNRMLEIAEKHDISALNDLIL